MADESAAPAGDAPKSHPLEHSWTLWFDNPRCVFLFVGGLRAKGTGAGARPAHPAPRFSSLPPPLPSQTNKHSGSQKVASWGQSLRSVYTFSTVEEFWG